MVQASPDAVAVLDLHEGICDPDAKTGCERWPENLRLRSTLGVLVKGRCKATNKCPYCRTLAVVETLEMLWLDAAEWAPEVYVVLTARQHLTRADTYDHLRQLRRAGRRRWPLLEWAVQVEFQKRGALHLNLLCKGVRAAEAYALGELLSDRWCARVDADPVGQKAKPVHDAGGLTKYLQKSLAHGLKKEQAPALGWNGHRTSQTRGYLVRPASVMREEARQSLRFKRHLRDALKAGLAGQQAEEAAHLALYEANELAWELCRLQQLPVEFDADGMPTDWIEGVLPMRS